MYQDIIDDITRGLSLRHPQAKSLQLLDQILPEKINNLTLENVRAISQDMTDFHYDFPSLCFALATGVGKTRLMGAMILYLYETRGIRNFFVVAPNLTIYEKLKKDFTYGSPKYVFPGQAGFGGQNPVVIDGENYHQMGWLFADNHKTKIIINVFNISKFNSTKETTKLKKISEYLGQSYFEYIQWLENLVVLMDESHRYKQDKSISALNELDPILWLEFTATPYITSGSKIVRSSNILYEYSLASAISDWLVKKPAIATRKNLADTVSNETLELTKINDGVYIHEETKLHLQVYAQNNNLPVVKPFMMINASDQKHADEIEKLVKSDWFFGGRYAEKVLKIYSWLGGADKDRAIKTLLDVEKIDNPIEIVIQVSMLKEWWDVNNLYTIVPLKAFTADILTEQTLGRWLRLPYSRITGDGYVDRLTVVAHDRFQQLIDAANKPDSLIRNKIDMSIIDLDEIPDLTSPKQLVLTTGQFDSAQDMIIKPTIQSQITQLWIDTEQAYIATQSIIKAQREVLQEAERINPSQSIDKTYITQKVQERLLIPQYYATITQAFGSIDSPEQQAKFIETISHDLTDQFLSRSIELPRVIFDYPDVQVSFDTSYKLNTSLFKQLLVADAPIIIRDLQSWQETGVLQVKLLSHYQWSIESCLISMILDIGISEFDYDLYSEWLYEMAHDAVQAMKENCPNQDDHFFKNIIQVYYKDVIFSELARQIRSVKTYLQWKPTVTVHSGSKTVKSEALETFAQWWMKYFRDFHESASTIWGYIFTGFKKWIARQCKFQSNKERIFACILENESETHIQKRLKPPLDMIQIYYFDLEHNQRTYNPDFVVQTNNLTYLIETKATNMMNDALVLRKKHAALEWIQAVNDSGNYGTWKYVLIPDEIIHENITFDGIIARS